MTGAALRPVSSIDVDFPKYISCLAQATPDNVPRISRLISLGANINSASDFTLLHQLIQLISTICSSKPRTMRRSSSLHQCPLPTQVARENASDIHLLEIPEPAFTEKGFLR
jgi:hypothetical protein